MAESTRQKRDYVSGLEVNAQFDTSPAQMDGKREIPVSAVFIPQRNIAHYRTLILQVERQYSNSLHWLVDLIGIFHNRL